MGKKALWTPLQLLLQNLSRLEQIAFFDAVLRDLGRKYLKHNYHFNSAAALSIEKQTSIGGVAAVVGGIANGNQYLEAHVIEWLTASNSDGTSLGLHMRRAVIATLALHEGRSSLEGRTNG